MKPKFTRLSLFIFLVIFIICVPGSAQAAKKRVRVAPAGSSGISYSSAKLSRVTHSVIVNFLNLGKVTKVNYELNYNANGMAQGAVGSVNPGGATDSRDLYFGTCSRGVCTPHYNITGATLVIRTVLKSGSVNTKLYRIKI